MKWFEFTQDNGDGSFSKVRFKTKEEAEDSLQWLLKNAPSWQGDAEGIEEVDTEAPYFFNTGEEIKDSWSEIQ